MLCLLATLSLLCLDGPPVQAGVAPPAMSVRFVDLTGDGELDQLGFAADGSVTVAVHGPNRSFVQLLQDLPRIHPTQAVVADLNGDLQPDVLLISAADCVFLAGEGTGYFVDNTKAMGLAHLTAMRSCEVVDADSDGTSDLLFHGLDADHLFWGQAGGPFLEQAPPAVGHAQAVVGGRAQAPTAIGDLPQAPELVTAGLTQEQKRILGHMSMEMLDDGAGNPLPMLRITGVNVQIVSGSGATNGHPGIPYTTHPELTTTNGLGNLIVGYMEEKHSGTNPQVRTGSHNLILGQQHNWTSFGGLIGGLLNTSSGPYSAILAGKQNETTAGLTAICGGTGNEAAGSYAVVVGGDGNKSIGHSAAILGGNGNQAIGIAACVSGGQSNIASKEYTNISAGHGNTTDAAWASICGGEGNMISDKGALSVIVGGEQNSITNQRNSILGGFNNSITGRHSTISGGQTNLASGEYCSISGGYENTAASGTVWIGGGGFNLADGPGSCISGGFQNTTLSLNSTVGGGANRTAQGEFDFVAGSLFSDT